MAADLDAILRDAVRPAYELLPSKMQSDRASVMLLAIGLQESRFTARRQVKGPARGFWQFERAGVAGVLKHKATQGYAHSVCRELSYQPTVDAVYPALERDDVLAAAFARLNLWWDAAPLPAMTDAQAAWSLYLRTWRPGQPHPETWARLHAQAVDTIEGIQ